MLCACFRVVPDGVAVGKGAALGNLGQSGALPRPPAANEPKAHHLATAPSRWVLGQRPWRGALRPSAGLCGGGRSLWGTWVRPLDDPLKDFGIDGRVGAPVIGCPSQALPDAPERRNLGAGLVGGGRFAGLLRAGCGSAREYRRLPLGRFLFWAMSWKE